MRVFKRKRFEDYVNIIIASRSHIDFQLKYINNLHSHIHAEKSHFLYLSLRIKCALCLPISYRNLHGSKCLVKINYMKFRDFLVAAFLTAERHGYCNRARYDIFEISSIADEYSLAGYTLKSKHGLNTPNTQR